MTFSLRPYQTEMVEQTRQRISAGARTILECLPTGGGKTALTGYMLKSASEKGHRCWFIVHRRELVKQSVITFNRVGLAHGIIAAGFPSDPRQAVQVCSIDTLRRRFDRLTPPKVIVWDECFPAGTPVDGRPIESLRPGDMVRSFNHQTGRVEIRPVVRLFRSSPRYVAEVRLSNGRSIACTPGHPFWSTSRSCYVPAQDLTCLDVVAGIIGKHDEHNAMQGVRCERRYHHQVSEGQGANREVVLLEGMQLGVSIAGLVRNHGENEPQVCIGTDDGAQPHAPGDGAREGSHFAASDGMEASQAGRQRARPDYSPGGARRRLGMGDGDDRPNRHSWLRHPNALQIGRGEPGPEGSGRGRRIQPLLTGAAGAGPEEGELAECARVESVTIYERGSGPGFARLCPEGAVYNIEVEGNHNYFAHGVLVHNCHHVGAKSWADVHAAFPDAIHIGLSATPERLDGVGLGQWFQTMVTGPTVRDLISQGFLAPYRLFAPSGVNLSGVHTRAGDFAQDEVAQIMDKPAITGDAVAHYQRLSSGRRAVAFCCSIQHSEHVVQAFRNAGIPAAHLDGETDNVVRDATIKKFERGEIMVLSNVGLFSEGFDLPAIETCILLRPTQSLGMYLQQCGRALRPCDGKTEALILDHAGNSGRHGLPDDIREWSLQGRAKRKKKNQDDGPPVRTCAKCFAALNLAAKVCVFCGAPVEIQAREVEQRDGELEEVQRREERKQQIRAQARAETLDDLIAIGRSRGYRSPERWAAAIFHYRQQKRAASYIAKNIQGAGL